MDKAKKKQDRYGCVFVGVQMYLSALLLIEVFVCVCVCVCFSFLQLQNEKEKLFIESRLDSEDQSPHVVLYICARACFVELNLMRWFAKRSMTFK